MEEMPAVSVRATQSEQLSCRTWTGAAFALAGAGEVVLTGGVEQLTYEEVQGALTSP